MAVLMRTEMQGATIEQLKPFLTQVKARMTSFPGFIAQASGPIPGGVQITEVWESQGDHERWVREVVGPLAAEQLGITDVPPVQYLPLDDFVTR